MMFIPDDSSDTSVMVDSDDDAGLDDSSGILSNSERAKDTTIELVDVSLSLAARLLSPSA